MADQSDQTRAARQLRPCILLLGPPGSGKGTQAELLSTKLGLATISTGEMLRAAVEGGSELGRRVERVMATGALVDDSLMAEVVAQSLKKPEAGGGVFLDGYPRTIGQAGDLERILDEAQAEIVAAIAIRVAEDVLIERMTGRGRSDDEEEVIQERIRVYREKTEPLIGYYRKLGLLEEVDGTQTIEAVNADILEVLSAAGVFRVPGGVAQPQPRRA